MQGVYRAAVDVSTVTTAKTLLYLAVPATAVLEILSARITCQDESTNEQIFAELNRISSLGTPTFGTGITPKPTEEASAASNVTASGNVTASEPTYDAAGDAIARGGAQKQGGWEYYPLPEERPVIAPSDNIGLRTLNTLTSCTLTAEITYREIG